MELTQHTCGECQQFKDGKCQEWNREVYADRRACKLAYWNDYFGDHEVQKMMDEENQK